MNILFSVILCISGETIDEAASRVLKAKTGFSDVFLEEVKVFSELTRHPLARVITVAYFSLIKIDEDHLAFLEKDDYLQWIPVNELTSLAFDHYDIMHYSLEKLRELIRQQPIVFNLLPKHFTLFQFQILYEIILGKKVDKRNFRRKLLSRDILIDSGVKQSDVRHRPAKLYSFDKEEYLRRREDRLFFDL